MRIRTVLAFILTFALACFVVPGIAQTAVKPVPTPDLSKLPSASADELRRARAEFDKVKEHHTGEALGETYGLLGSAYARAGLVDAAAVALDNAIAVAPKDSRWIYARGVLALATGQSAAATGYFDRAFALNKSYLPIRTAVANQKIAAGDLDGARQVLAEFTARRQDQAVPYAILGDIALKQKRYDDAIAQLNHALRLEPAANRLYTPLAAAYAASGNAKAAAEARAKAGSVSPTLGDPIGSRLIGEGAAPAAASTATTAPKPGEQAIGEAMAAFGSGNYAAARTALDRAIQQAPRDATPLALYARVEAAAGNLAAAQSRAAAAVALDAKNPVAHLSQGLVLEMRGDDGGAERAYGQAIRLEPTAESLRLALGNLLMRTGRPALAADQFRAVTTTNPGNGLGWTGLVASQVQAGQCVTALKDINAALSKDAHNPYLMQLFVRLASTCGTPTAAEKRMALDYAGKLYTGGDDSASIAEAYALALAAHGKWDDAVSTQQAAMFIVLRSGGAGAVEPYRSFLQQFQAHKLPDRPWPASSELFHPQRPAPDPKPATAAPAPKK